MPFYSNEVVKPIVAAPTVLAPLTPVYADQYPGEWINWTIGDKIDREFIAPKQRYFRANGSAIVYGNGKGRTDDLIKRVERSNAGKIINYYNITYACNLAYKDISADYFVITNKLLASRVTKDLHSRCYTRPEILRIHNDMNLLPINQALDAGTSAAMMACFHGADKIFLVGFDGCPDKRVNHVYVNEQFYPNNSDLINDEKWQDNLARLIMTYPKVKFYRVNASPPSSRPLLRYPNYQVIDTRQFISLADI